MSATVRSRVPLFIGAIAVAAIAACSDPTTPTTPTAPIALNKATPAAIDSTECRGWIVVDGVLVCKDPE